MTYRLKVYKAGSQWTFDIIKKTMFPVNTWTSMTYWPVVWTGLYYDSQQEALTEGLKVFTWWLGVFTAEQPY